MPYNLTKYTCPECGLSMFRASPFPPTRSYSLPYCRNHGKGANTRTEVSAYWTNISSLDEKEVGASGATEISDDLRKHGSDENRSGDMPRWISSDVVGIQREIRQRSVRDARADRKGFEDNCRYGYSRDQVVGAGELDELEITLLAERAKNTVDSLPLCTIEALVYSDSDLVSLIHRLRLLLEPEGLKLTPVTGIENPICHVWYIKKGNRFCWLSIGTIQRRGHQNQTEHFIRCLSQKS